jgi:adenosylcobinamide-GDP ribazoletransferase
MTQELRLFFIALQFLTRVPVPRRLGYEPAWLQACLRHFPLVGACVGAWAAAVFWLALLLWPPLVASTVSLVATVLLTSAFHEDGLADTCDALGGAVSRERALAIMKDSRIGSYGAVALVLALVLKVTAVAGLASSAHTDGLAWAAMALIWSHAVSRAAPVWLVWRLPYAGDAEHAKAKPLATRASGSGLAVALVWVGVASGAAVSVTVWNGASSWAAALWAALSALAACASATLCCARWLRRRLGGFTGDTLGAAQQIVELVGLLTWLAWLPFTGGPHA